MKSSDFSSLYRPPPSPLLFSIPSAGLFITNLDVAGLAAYRYFILLYAAQLAPGLIASSRDALSRPAPDCTAVVRPIPPHRGSVAGNAIKSSPASFSRARPPNLSPFLRENSFITDAPVVRRCRFRTTLAVVMRRGGGESAS